MVRELFFMYPVVSNLAWIWFMSVRVLQLGKRMSVGSVEFHGWFEFAQTSISFSKAFEICNTFLLRQNYVKQLERDWMECRRSIDS